MIPLATKIQSATSRFFRLTDAVRPSHQVPQVIREGYRIEKFRDPHSRKRIPMLAASISAEKLFEVFIDLLTPLGESLNAVLETSHDFTDDFHLDLRRGDIDAPVLESNLYDFEELLVNDGCAGIAVLAQDRPIEVQLDEHKLIYVYAHDLKPFRRILRAHGICRDDEMRLIAESEHVHLSSPEYAEEFRQLACRIGADDDESVLSDESESGMLGW